MSLHAGVLSTLLLAICDRCHTRSFHQMCQFEEERILPMILKIRLESESGRAEELTT